MKNFFVREMVEELALNAPEAGGEAFVFLFSFCNLFLYTGMMKMHIAGAAEYRALFNVDETVSTTEKVSVETKSRFARFRPTGHLKCI